MGTGQGLSNDKHRLHSLLSVKCVVGGPPQTQWSERTRKKEKRTEEERRGGDRVIKGLTVKQEEEKGCIIKEEVGRQWQKKKKATGEETNTDSQCVKPTVGAQAVVDN